MAITMTVGGASQKPRSVRLNYTAKNRGTATFDIPYKTSGSGIVRPALDNQVLMLSGATRFFGGVVVDMQETSLVGQNGGDIGTLISVTASDFNIYTTRLSVHQVVYTAGSVTRKQILQDLVNNFLNPYFATTLGTVTNGATFDELRFDNVTIEEVLNYVCQLTGEVWYIDENNVLQCEAVGASSTGLSLTQANTLWNRISYQRTQYANMVNVICGPDDSHEVSDTFPAGVATSFTLTPYTYVSSRGYVIETTGGLDVYLPLGRFGLDPTTWTIDTSTTPPTLHRTSGIPGGTTARFIYTAKFPFTIQRTNASEVTARGPFEVTIQAPGIMDYTAGASYATSLVTSLSNNSRALVEIGLRSPSVLVPRPGKTVTLALAARNISSATFVIVAVNYEFEISASNTIRQTLELTSGSSLPRVWQDYFSQGGSGSSGIAGILTGTVQATSSGMFETDITAHSGATDEISLKQNAVGSAALISNSSCVGPAVVIGSPANSWSWAIVANYIHLSSGISGGSGRRALCFLYVPGSGSANGAMSLTQDSAGTAGVYHLTPENPSATLNIGATASQIGVGFRVGGVYAQSTVDSSGTIVSGGVATLNSVVVNVLVGTFGNSLSYDGANQLFIGVPGTTTAKKLTVIDSAGVGLFTVNGVGDISSTGKGAIGGDFSVNTTKFTVSASTGNIACAGTITERGRSTPLGEWTSPSFNAGDFTASGSMTWTVASGDVTTFAWAIEGKKMTVALVLLTTTVGGTPSTNLQVLIPGSFTAAKTIQNACELLDNGARTTGRIGVTAGSTTISIQRTDVANFAASTDNSAVRAEIVFEVQ